MKSLKGTWSQAIGAFLLPMLVIALVRWLVLEPFVIPSGSMIPNLLVNDHILVNKLSFGIQIPFSEKLFFLWNAPKRGDIVVFRSPENPSIFFIKRVIGISGDTVELKAGRLFINDKEQAQEIQSQYQNDYFSYYKEENRLIRYKDRENSNYKKFQVPAKSYFMMGDNRDASSDSRVWGEVGEELLVGAPLFIWLSCEEKLSSMPVLCDPKTIQWSRIFTFIK